MNEIIALAVAIGGGMGFLALKKPDAYKKFLPIASGILSVVFVGGLFYNLGYVEGATRQGNPHAPDWIWLASGLGFAGLLYCQLLGWLFDSENVDRRPNRVKKPRAKNYDEK